MSVPGRAIIRTNASTELLWQIAESGELSELDAILKKGADINGCNRNGVSALMRAAAAGRHEMVQSLLEHGADVDAHRDDGFTALLLATFFGHLETVQILVEHGAKLDQTTRCGTSAADWARARAWREIAEYLHDPPRIRRTPTPAPFKSNSDRAVTKPVVVEGVFSDQARKPSPEPAVIAAEPEVEESEIRLPEVRTLKDPPEIWELVHSATPEFNPGTAFISRATANWTNRILFGLLLCVVAVGSAYAIMRFRAAPKSITSVETAKTVPGKTNAQPPHSTTSASEQSQSTSVSTQPNPQPVLAPTEQNISNVPVGRAYTNGRARGRSTKVPEPTDNQNVDNAVKSVSEAQPISPKPERPAGTPAETQAGKKATPGGLSPQLIGPATPGGTPKPKVIQWP